MSSPMSASPLHHDSSLEKLEDGDTQTIDALIEVLRTINETTFSRSAVASGRPRVPLCTDLTSMPIEDASVEWSQDRRPYIAVARIIVAEQSAWSEVCSAASDGGMAFSPRHARCGNQPLGTLARARKAAYEVKSKGQFFTSFAQTNRCHCEGCKVPGSVHCGTSRITDAS